MMHTKLYMAINLKVEDEVKVMGSSCGGCVWKFVLIPYFLYRNRGG